MRPQRGTCTLSQEHQEATEGWHWGMCVPNHRDHFGCRWKRVGQDWLGATLVIQQETDGSLVGGVGGELERNKVGKVTTIHLPISTSW